MDLSRDSRMGGLDSCERHREDDASSMRSMALSGRKREEMYRAE